MTDIPEHADAPDEQLNAPAARVSPALIVMTVIPLLGLAAALGLMLANMSQQPTGDDRVVARVGSLDKPMPDFMLTSLDGQPIDLAQYRGRPLFVNFWGTWCAPCVSELPELQAFAAAQGEDGAVVIASNNTEQTDAIERFFEANGLTLPDVQFVLDSDSVMYRWFGVYQMPSTYLIDRDGVVRSVKYGPFTVAGMQSYLDELTARDAANGG